MSQMHHDDGRFASSLTASPLVQRFVLGVAVALTGYHVAGKMRSEIRMHVGRPEEGEVGLLVKADRPLLAVDINQASAAELALLPGIGPISATAIVESRKVEGPFLAVADLERVHGIGPKTVQTVRPYLLPLTDDAEKIASAVP